MCTKWLFTTHGLSRWSEDSPAPCLCLSPPQLLSERGRSSCRFWELYKINLPTSVTLISEKRGSPSLPALPHLLSLSLHTHTHKHLLWCATLCIYTPSTCFPFPPRSSRYSHPIYNPIDTVSCGVLLQESINLQLSATIAIGSPPLPLTPAVDLCVCVSLPGSNFFCVSRKWLTTGQD